MEIFIYVIDATFITALVPYFKVKLSSCFIINVLSFYYFRYVRGFVDMRCKLSITIFLLFSLFPVIYQNLQLIY